MNSKLLKKEANAISVLRSFEPKDEKGYYLCYSGGKDSDCIRILAALADVKHDIVHNLTTVDAPETIYYIRSVPGAIINRPPKTMWQLIVEKRMPPTRLARYCCAELKERGGNGRLKITGVRKAESANRAESADLVRIIGKPKTNQRLADEIGAGYNVTKQNGLIMNTDNVESRRLVEHCYRTSTVMVNPIVDWTDSDVWEFLHHYGCESNPLYQCGKSRIGCIGCPMAGQRGQKREFAQYPKYRANYVRAFDRMLKKRIEDGIPAESWETGEDVMRWWIGDNPLQITLDDYDAFLDEMEAIE